MRVRRSVDTPELLRPLLTPTDSSDDDTAEAKTVNTAALLVAAGIDSFTFVNAYFFMNEALDSIFGRASTADRDFAGDRDFGHIFRSIKHLMSLRTTLPKEAEWELIALQFLQIGKLIEIDLKQARDQHDAGHYPKGNLTFSVKVRLYGDLLGIIDRELPREAADTLKAIYPDSDSLAAYPKP